MVLCKFYLQGNCRYGNRCWNEHHADSNPNATLRGDYYVSNDSRSLWRKNTQQPSFSFMQALNTPNRYAALSHDRHMGQQNFTEDMWDDNESYNSFSFQKGGAFGSSGNQFGSAHQGSSNSKFNLSHLIQPSSRSGQFSTKAPVEFSFNAAHQTSQGSNRAVVPPTSFSFTGALNRTQPKDPVTFSFNAAHQASQSSNRPVAPQTTSTFSFTGALNKTQTKDPVAYSFKAAQNQLNTPFNNQTTSRTAVPTQNTSFFGKNHNVSQPLFGKSNIASDHTKASNITKSFETEVPSILATSDVLKVVGVYTKMVHLKHWESEQFCATAFSLGKIPTVPPPQELC